MIARSTSDAVRVVAMAGVVVIHTTEPASLGLIAHHQVLSSDALATMLNQVLRFSVPLFVLLSGYAMAARERAMASRVGLPEPVVRVWPFWRDRLLRLAVPLLVWSLIYRLVEVPAPPAAEPTWGDILAGLPMDMLTGAAEYHLYFIVILLQCCVLFPWLIRLRSGWWTVAAFALALVWLAPAPDLLVAAGVQLPGLPGYALPAWLGWFLLGVQAGQSPPAPTSRGWATLAVVLGAVLICVEWWWQSFRLPDPGWFGHSFRWTVFAYSLACWWALRAWDGPIAAWLAIPRRAAVLTWLVGLSFPVYLLHPLILDALVGSGMTNMVLLTVTLSVLSVSAAALMGRLLRSWPLVARSCGW